MGPRPARRTLIYSVVLLLALVACGGGGGSGPVRALPVKPAASLRVMTYNMNYGMAGDPPGITAIAFVSPDIAFLQETNERWQRAIVARLGERYPHVRFEHSNKHLGGGMGLLSKYPIVELEQLDSVVGAHFAWRVVLDTNIGRIQALAVHLRQPMSDGGSWVIGYFSTGADRLREIQYHVEALDSTLPTLVIGDFNEEGDGKAMQFLSDRGYVDVLAEHGIKQPTWRRHIGLDGRITFRFQLDHILHDERLAAIAAGVADSGRSDHKPVWADFEPIAP